MVLLEFNLTCEYARERKKRGKASKKDLAAMQAAASAMPTGSLHKDESASPKARSITGDSPPSGLSELERIDSTASVDPSSNHIQRPSASRSMSMNEGLSGDGQIRQQPSLHRANSVGATTTDLPQSPVGFDQAHPQQEMQQPFDTPMAGLGMNEFGPLHGIDRATMHANGLNQMSMLPQASSNHGQGGMIDSQSFSNFTDPNFGMLNPTNQQPPMNGYRYPPPTGSPVPGFMGFTPANASPGWASLPSPSGSSNPAISGRPSGGLKYPVLQPLLPYLVSIIPPALACDLLELYFASSSSAQLRPLSPYVLGYVLRKKSILHPIRPRKCSTALLASMLWVSAQTSEAAFLTSPPASRGRVCQKLLELTISLLKPLVHGPTSGETSPNYASTMVINGVALGGFGVSIDHVSAESSATGAIDDVATYIHLATVVSASEYKAASLRWWNAAWSLARELKLGRELPPNPSTGNNNDLAVEGEMDTEGIQQQQQQQQQQSIDQRQSTGRIEQTSHEMISEEDREERRRIWWLLYTMDRHLALCYNRPLFLLDKECDGLLQPMNDSIWQSGDFSKADSVCYSAAGNAPKPRRRGPTFECTGHSIFGYFLPLMSILGEIVDLNHARNHPRFGLGFRNSSEWDTTAQEICTQLDAYGQSLKEFEMDAVSKLANSNENQDATTNPHPNSTGADQTTPSAASSTSRMTESVYQTKIVVAYGTHIMHVLHILLTGKWDPISLLDDNDLWISSQSFITATSHAVSAAEAISDILEFDPDLSFMPFFFGVYLLQGSFLLLLIADKLQGEASPSVVKACETIVRAHEACVVTLNTEYQVSLLMIFLTFTYWDLADSFLTAQLPQSDAIGSDASPRSHTSRFR